MGPLTTIGLPVALGIIMFGLGLSLRPADFARVAKHPKAVIVALACQLILLPAICLGLVVLFRLPPILAVGMMLLAASPGGTTANLYSHLFRGDVALNISLTAVNSVIAVFTLPFITNFAIGLFMPGESGLGLEFSKTVEVFVIVLGPVILGMLVRWWKPKFADAMDRPVRIASMIILAIVIIGAIIANREILLANVGALAGITVAVLRPEPHDRLLRAAAVPRRAQAGGGECLRDRHPQRDAGDRDRADGAGQRRAVAACRGLQRADVLHRAAVRVVRRSSRPKDARRAGAARAQ